MYIELEWLLVCIFTLLFIIGLIWVNRDNDSGYLGGLSGCMGSMICLILYLAFWVAWLIIY